MRICGKWIAVLAVSVSGMSHGQSVATNCDAVLLARSTTLIQQDSYLAANWLNAIDSATRDNIEKGGSLGIGELSAKYKEANRHESLQKSLQQSGTSQSQSLTLVKMETPQGNVQAWVECKRQQSNVAILEVVPRGRYNDLIFAATIHFYPARGAADTALRQISTTCGETIRGMPNELKQGTFEVQLVRTSPQQKISCGINAIANGESRSASIDIPAYSGEVDR